MKTKTKQKAQPTGKPLYKNPWAIVCGIVLLIIFLLGISYLMFLRQVSEESKAFGAARNNLSELKGALEAVDPGSPWEFDAYCGYGGNTFSRGHRTCIARLELDKVFTAAPRGIIDNYIMILENRSDIVSKKREAVSLPSTDPAIKSNIIYDYDFKLPNKSVGCTVVAYIYTSGRLNIQITCLGDAKREYYPCKAKPRSHCNDTYTRFSIDDGWLETSW